MNHAPSPSEHNEPTTDQKIQIQNQRLLDKESLCSQRFYVICMLNPAFIFNPQTASLDHSGLLFVGADLFCVVCAVGVPEFSCVGVWYTFANVKTTVPDNNMVLLAVYEMDYAINAIHGIDGMIGYFLYYNLTVQAITTIGMEIGLEFSHQIISKIGISLLVIGNEFIYKDIFSVQNYYRYQLPNGTIQNSIILAPVHTPYKYLPFLNSARIKTRLNSNNQIIVFWNFNNSTNKLTSITYDDAEYSAENFTARVLLIYQIYAESTYSVILQVFSQYQTNNSNFQATFNQFQDQKSIFFAGLTRLDYRASYNNLNKGLKWTINKYTSTLQAPLKFTLSMDSQFQMFQYSFFTLSRKNCPETHPFRGLNSTNHTVCFDECRQDQYLVYNSTYKSFNCTDCNMSHCKTCVAAGKCNSCFDGYTFDSVNYNCTLSPGYCLNSQNQSQKCGDAMTNCLNCSSNTTCTICEHGFFLNTSNLCSPCSDLTADCTQCNSTHCVNCALPKVLINATLCSLPMDPQPLPTPNGVSGTCDDPNCITCQTGNSSICLKCSSLLYELQNGRCVVLCGDGIIFGTDVCDDGNQISFDGCSADCQTLESGFVCNNVSSQMPGFSMSECYLNRTVTLTVASIEKPLTENKVNLYFRNPEPMVAAWQEMEINNELTKAFTLKIPRFDSGVPGHFFNYTASFVKSPEIISKLRLRAKNLSPSELYSQKFLARNLQSSTTAPVFLPEHYEFILLEVLYSPDAPGSVPQHEISKKSLNQQTMSLSFDPKISQRSIFTKNQSPLLFASSFSLKADDNQVIQFYDQSYYQKLDLVGLLSKVIGFSCILLIVIGLASFCVDGRNSKQMLVAVETSFVVQLTYFSLLGLGEINPMFSNMASGLKFSAGYDLMVDQEGMQTFRELSGMGVESVSMVSNVNLSFMLVLVCQVLGGVLLLLNKFARKQPQMQIKNEETQNDEILDSSKKIQKDDSEESSKKVSPTEEESTLTKVGMFLVFNAGFGLFLFFLYKLMFFSLIQFKYGLDSFSALDMMVLGSTVLMLLFYTFCLVKRLEWFGSFILKLTLRQPKINIMETLAKNKVIDPSKIKKIEARFLDYVKSLPDDQKPEAMRSVELSATQINIKLWYLLIIFVEHAINMSVVVFLGPLGSSNRISSVVLYVALFVFVCKYSPYPTSSLYRLYFTYFTGGVVQTLLFIRGMILEFGSSSSRVGMTETSLGVYFPFSVVALLLLLCMVGLVYSVYGIRRVRCCKLEMDWEKIGLTGVMKLKLEAFIVEELNGKFHLSPLLQGGEFEGSNLEEDEEFNKLDEESFGSQNARNEDCLVDGEVSNRNGSDLKGKKSFSGQPMMRGRRCRKQVEELDVKINQELTTKALKKQIKQKMLNNKLNEKIQERQRLKLEGTDRQSKNSILFESKKSIGEQNEKHAEENAANESQAQQNTSMIMESIGKVYFEEARLRGDETVKKNADTTAKQEKEAYLYTDNKEYYNVYEEFDMI